MLSRQYSGEGDETSMTKTGTRSAAGSLAPQKDSRWQNSRVYMVAIAVYMGIFLFGYDTGVGGSLDTLPVFMKEFGYDKASASSQANTESWIVSILMLGAFAGSVVATFVTNWIGRKNGLIGYTVIFVIGSAIQTACFGSVGQLEAGRFIGGFGVGGMSSISPVYVAEMCPRQIRGRVTGLFQVIVAIGVAISFWLAYGLSIHYPNTGMQWRFPLGFQILPGAIMLAILPFVPESPRYLIYKGKNDLALRNLAWVRKRETTDPWIVEEINEITTALDEEREATKGLAIGEILKKGNRERFFIAFMLFFCQQWCGQNSISYYAPTIFKAIGIRGTSTSLLTSGIYGIVKIVATAAFIWFGIETAGRSKAIGIGCAWMSIMLWIIGAIFYTHPPNATATTVSQASIGMAACIYIFVIPYCFSAGPVPWVYCSEIFPMRLRGAGMATASASQWIFNFCLTKITPKLILQLPNGKIFFLFAAFNIFNSVCGFLLPETKGKTLEEMDVIFGTISAEQRAADLERHAAGARNMVLEASEVRVDNTKVEK